MFKNAFKKKRKGFALTFELLMTMVMFTMLINATTYLMTSFNTLKFIHTVQVSTVTSMAKWGGTHSNAYRVNGVSEDIIQTAQGYLNEFAPNFHATISGGPGIITPGNDKCWCKLEWEYPEFWGYSMGGRKTSRIEMQGIMRPGALL